MSKKRKKPIEEIKVFNRQILLFAVFSLVLIFIGLGCLSAGDADVAIFFIICGVFVMAGAFVFPTYFVFSSKGVKAFWLLPFKKTVYWSAVNSIVEYKRFFSDDGSAKYVLNYRSEYNGRQAVREFELPRSKKIKKLVEKYAKYKII